MNERVVCAANKCGDAMLIGVRHWDEHMRRQYGAASGEGFNTCDEEQGFLTNHGIFVSRQAAWKIAQAAGQIIRRVGGDTANGGTLYSENLY